MVLEQVTKYVDAGMKARILIWARHSVVRRHNDGHARATHLLHHLCGDEIG